MNRFITLSCIVFLFSSFSLFAQNKVNSYKYVIIPMQYEFQKSEDQYQVNSLTKFLFDKEGFTTFFSSDKFPEELANNSCSALKANIKSNSSLFSTKLVFELTDCYNNVVFTSVEGSSRIKDYKKSYNEAVRKAFESIKELDYEYDGSEQVDTKILLDPELKATPVVIAEETNEQTVNEIMQEVEEVEKEAVIVSNDEVKNATKNVESEVGTVEKVAEAAVVTAIVVPTEEQSDLPKEVIKYSIEGTYFIDMWGKCTISKKGKDYKVVGGDENFEFATITTTSQPYLFMIKKVGFKETKLLVLDENGNLKIDSNEGAKIYKRVD